MSMHRMESVFERFMQLTTQLGHTPLSVAVQRGSMDVFRKLLELHVDVNVLDKRKMSALIHAAHAGNADAVSLLLKNHADV